MANNYQTQPLGCYGHSSIVGHGQKENHAFKLLITISLKLNITPQRQKNTYILIINNNTIQFNSIQFTHFCQITSKKWWYI